MSEALKGLILGVVQGLTEFLPVSSSGHLALLEHYLGIKEEGLFFGVMLHFATLLAVLVYFRREILDYIRKPRVLFYIVLVSIPTGVIGLSLKDRVEVLWGHPKFVAGMLLISAVIAFLVDRIEGRGGLQELGIAGALGIGVFQGVAVVPGISRSGSTILASVLAGLSKEEAAPFSFIVSIPAIAGATFLEAVEAGTKGVSLNTAHLLGMVAAFVVGLLSLKLFVSFLKNRRFVVFSIYLLLVSLFVFVYG